jgi:gliding motility-associated-like protein
LPNGVIATSSTPQFGFQTGMTAGATYFVSAIAGNNDGAGNVDTSDVCLSISPGVPVVFHDPPTATLSGAASFCAGGNAAFQIQFTGTPPFKFVYAINGNPQAPITAPGFTFSITTNNVQQNQVFTLVSVEDAFCPGTVSGTATVDIIPPPTGALIGGIVICEGGTATLGLSLTGGTSYDVTIGGGANPIVLTGVQDGATVDVTPTVTTTYTITALTANGNSCPVEIGESAIVTVSDLSATAQVSDYNGFGVSCPNENDGSIAVTPVGNFLPATANWSNGAASLQIGNLAAGTYSLTLTDQAGCIWLDSFVLTAPPELAIQTSTASPTCFGDNDGSVTVESVLGGAGPYTLALNGLTFQTTDSFPTSIGLLEAGDYLLEVEDANGCVTDESVTVPAPPQVTINLGPDVTISFGDSTLLQALLNTTAYDTFAWSPVDYLQTPDSLATWVRPPQSQIYTFTVVDTAGCSVSDEIKVTVQKAKRIFLPNAIRPASNEFNDIFTVFAGAEVTQVRSMRIYDRWGEMLFENQNFVPNEPQFGWSGRARGDEVNPGVYVYVVEVEYFDGSSEVFSGDVTVVR